MLTAACHSWVVDDDGDGAHSVRIVPVSCVQGDKGASSSTSLSGEGEISVCPLMIVADRVGVSRDAGTGRPVLRVVFFF